MNILCVLSVKSPKFLKGRPVRLFKTSGFPHNPELFRDVNEDNAVTILSN